MTLALLAALDTAVEEFRRRLAAVKNEDWDAATPCTEWDTRYLVAHVVGGNRFTALVLDGRTAADAMAAVMGAVQLGASPLGDFDESVAAQRAGFARHETGDAVVSHPLRELPVEQFLGMRVFDIAVHAWDLSMAIGHDAALDESLVGAVLEVVRREAPGMGFGIEPCAVARPEASPLEQLLDLSGRCAEPART